MKARPDVANGDLDTLHELQIHRAVGEQVHHTETTTYRFRSTTVTGCSPRVLTRLKGILVTALGSREDKQMESKARMALGRWQAPRI